MRKDVIYAVNERGEYSWRSLADLERIVDALGVSALDDDNDYYWRA